MGPVRVGWLRARATGLGMGIAAVLLAGGCGSGTDVAPGGVCQRDEECQTGECVDGRCVVEPCMDEDGDGAGLGPGCDVYDCDDSDPSIPADEESCNGIDDDCDATLDEGCPCLTLDGEMLTDGATRPCGMGRCSGVQTCEKGSWGECDGPEPAERETCFNGTDDNCNGTQDEGCCPDEERYCEDAMECSSNGICK